VEIPDKINEIQDRPSVVVIGPRAMEGSGEAVCANDQGEFEGAKTGAS
jgi:hypothetical protein